MTNKDKLRRINHLMGKYYTHSLYFSNWKRIDLETAKAQDEKSGIGYRKKEFTEKIEIYKLAEELSISDDELKELWFKKWNERQKRKAFYKLKPQKEGRDNKDVRVGSGYPAYYQNTIRYPSKKRSVKTWKKFYKLFPHAAIADGWNGKTSKRMK